MDIVGLEVLEDLINKFEFEEYTEYWQNGDYYGYLVIEGLIHFYENIDGTYLMDIMIAVDGNIDEEWGMEQYPKY